jgi:hypothetical protein
MEKCRFNKLKHFHGRNRETGRFQAIDLAICTARGGADQSTRSFFEIRQEPFKVCTVEGACTACTTARPIKI